MDKKQNNNNNKPTLNEVKGFLDEMCSLYGVDGTNENKPLSVEEVKTTLRETMNMTVADAMENITFMQSSKQMEATTKK